MTFGRHVRILVGLASAALLLAIGAAAQGAWSWIELSSTALTVPTPAAGKVYIYVRTAASIPRVYYKTDSGAEYGPLDAGGTGGLPAGAIILVASGSCPTGFTEVAGLAGKFLLGTSNAAGDVGTTGGSDNITPAGTNSAPGFTGSAWSAPAISWPAGVPTHSGTAISDHASHTHTYTDVIAHNHTQDAHNHTQDTHNHTQNAHSHTVTSVGSAATGSTTNLTGTSDTTSTTATAANATAVNQTTVATNQAATATNQAAGIATGTTAGPSATLTHTVSSQGTVAWPAGVPTIGAYTPAGTVAAPTFTGSSFDNRPAWLKVIFCSAN